MGSPAARMGDMCTGHGCYPPRPNCAGSGNVFINSRGAHRKGDGWLPHCCPKPKGMDCHGGNTTGGSGKVFVNSISLARVGDSVSCGSSISTGSTNVSSG